MASNNIILFVFIVIIIGIIVYFYYNYKSSSKICNKKDNKKDNKKGAKKKVRFNDNVVIGKDKINVDNLSSEAFSTDNRSDLNLTDSVGSSSGRSISDTMENIVPNNLSPENQDSQWDSNFGLPLMDDVSKAKIINKMKKNYDNYPKSLGEFAKYQTDDSTIIKTDATIDPFNPGSKSGQLKGKTIEEIYDAQVAGPKAKPKRIKHQDKSMTTYEDENESNGGRLTNSNLHAVDGISGSYQTSTFGDDF